MRNSFSILLIFLLSGCMSDFDKTQTFSSEELEYYHGLFLQEAKKRNIAITQRASIIFDSLGTSGNYAVHASCYPKKCKVVVSYQYWKWFSETRKKLTIFHELGHCYLGKNHVSKEDTLAIMNPIIDPKMIELYIKNPKPFLNFLFK